MTDEPTLRTKTDVLDLVISFLMDHEKQMDQMLERIERIADRLSSKGTRINPLSADVETTGYQPDKFTITIDNPENYGSIKSIKIDWEKPEYEVDPESQEVLSFLEEIEQIYKKDSTNVSNQ
jgi:predicted Zn-ribbon and HTH transcriptional regulator